MSVHGYISLITYFMAMLGIGLFAYRKSTSDISGYLLGGRQVSPQVTALSAGASDMSGWILLGLPGAMFATGFDAVYIGIGLTIGAFINYLLVAPKLRVYTKLADNALTLPEFFANRFGEGKLAIRITAALIIVLFFTLYTSSGLVAGGKLFESAFGLNYTLGLVLTLGVVVAYTLLGGFLAVSLTDFVQGCIMFVALILVPLVAYLQFDSFAQVSTAAYQSIPSFSASINNLTLLGLLSTLSWGLGYFGQPHILVRFMAIRSVKEVPVARKIGMWWMVISLIGALCTGFVGVAYHKQFALVIDDPETIFIVFANILFHPLISGFLMAAILAAVMSTISSQLLVSASSLTEDIYRVLRNNPLASEKAVLIGRLGVIGVSLVALLLALDQNSSILSLVSHAWAGFGAAFGPLVLCCLYKKNLTYKAALAGIVSGALVVLVWSYLPLLPDGKTLNSLLYSIVPGSVVSAIVIWLVSAIDSPNSADTTKLFEQVTSELKQLSK